MKGNKQSNVMKKSMKNKGYVKDRITRIQIVCICGFHVGLNKPIKT